MAYRTKERVRELVCTIPTLEPEPGFDPLTVTVKSGLTFAELKAMPPLTQETLYADIQQQIAPYILAWNVEGRNEHGETVTLPPPAEAGPAIFEAADPLITIWLYNELRMLHLGGEDRKKDVRRSSATPPTSNESGSGSPPLVRKHRRSNLTATT